MITVEIDPMQPDEMLQIRVVNGDADTIKFAICGIDRSLLQTDGRSARRRRIAGTGLFKSRTALVEAVVREINGALRMVQR